ncbi:MAG: type III-B CRISPR module RAMP protein Cmr4 [Gammaproteobacteria bacterium]|nr:type III-B CRISPR module RAMP protein Cmr4 [Gammaproteobacteria bacterium]
MEKTLYYLHTISALHVGIGQGSGVIDLPIARERASFLPQVPGSSVKGVLRYEYDDDKDKENYSALFGPEPDKNASDYAGALAVGDGRLLALPVRSWKGTFAWATCPLILRHYQRDLTETGIAGIPTKIPQPAEDSACHTGNTELVDNNKINLEDVDLDTSHCQQTDDWAKWIADKFFHNDEPWQEIFKQHFLILPDNLLDFLAETATEIRTRIRIDSDTGTVQDGALWTEEYLPAETLLWGILGCDRARKKESSGKDGKVLLELLNDQIVQLGGNATTGGGQTRWIKGRASI